MKSIERVWQDLRFGCRQLGATPGYAAIAILTIAAGIGACTAMFSVVNGVLLRPLDLPHPDRLVLVGTSDLQGGGFTGATPGDYLEWARQATVFENLSFSFNRAYNLSIGGKVHPVNAVCVTANYFPTCGVPALLGRTFLPEENTAGRQFVAVLNQAIWQQQFGGRADVINQQILLNGQAYTIVGVMPDRPIARPVVYTPLVFSAEQREDFGAHDFSPLGRLKPGVSLAQAQTEMTIIAARIAAARPSTNKGEGAMVIPPLQRTTDGVRNQLLVLFGAVGFLLLIACVNVANLSLVRANARKREMAVRFALGASRGRIFQQLVCESLLTSVSGGILGALLAFVLTHALANFAAKFVPRSNEISIDGSVLGFTCVLAVLAGFSLGSFSAFQVIFGRTAGSLKDADRSASGGRDKQRTSAALIVVEIALALMLLAGTGLLVRTLGAMQRADLGMKADNVYGTGFTLNSGDKYGSPQRVTAFTDRALERLTAMPGIQAMAFATAVPISGQMNEYFALEGQSTDTIEHLAQADWNTVTPDYFRALSIPLLQGRGFARQDLPGAPRVAIINQAMARSYFPGKDPIGQRIMILTMANRPDVWREIVGVVGDVKSGALDKVHPQVYEPLAQDPIPSQNPLAPLILIMRTAGPSATLGSMVRDAFHDVEPDLLVGSLQPYDLLIESTWGQQKFSLILFSLFSGVALLLAAVGIYSVMAYAVSQRTREIGIRIALGALPWQILELIFSRGLKLLVAGLALGMAGSIATTRLLGSLLYQTSPYDPLTFAAIAVLLAVVALLACWIPARRATRVDPIVALRCE
jgi:putative ABC transport system permease protein